MFAVTEGALIYEAESLPEGFTGDAKKYRQFDVPEGYDVWEDGTPRPEQVVAVSEADPRDYRVFRYAREILGSGYRSTGKTYGGFRRVATNRGPA